LDLRGLAEDDVRTQLSLVVDAAIADERAREVADVTGGNPFFVRELARALADGTWTRGAPPATVRDLVIARLRAVSTDCRIFLEAAAIVGRHFSLPVVAAALGTSDAGLLDFADEAIGYGVIDRTGDDVGSYRFVHALTVTRSRAPSTAVAASRCIERSRSPSRRRTRAT
jgi:predicted ATPase